MKNDVGPSDAQQGNPTSFACVTSVIAKFNFAITFSRAHGIEVATRVCSQDLRYRFNLDVMF